LRKVTFHGDRARLGWNARETVLTPAKVASGAFGQVWSSPAFDSVTIAGKVLAPHIYATPLFVERAPAPPNGPFAGCVLDLAYAATSNAFVYAVATTERSCNGARVTPGTIVWRTMLGSADVAILDGGVAVGILGTPYIDLDRGRLYVASMDAKAGWQVFALELASGAIAPGWPITVNDAALAPVNKNGPASFNPEPRAVSQRGALNLSIDGGLLYVPFAGYLDKAVGWMVAIDTRQAKIAAAFAGAPSLENEANGGIWGPGGPSVDEGHVYATTGNSPIGSLQSPGVWGQSLLDFTPTLDLLATYTPFNYCAMDRYDTDLGGSSPLLLPPLDPLSTSTPHLMAFGGKQGNVYLLDRDHVPGTTDHRPACDEKQLESARDTSLLPPEPQPQFGARGPLNVFGPYTEDFGNLDFARMRTTPAYFRDAAGQQQLFVSGTTKQRDPATGGMTAATMPPCLARLRIALEAGKPAYLAIDARETTVTLVNPGSPVLSSNGANDAIVWILDENGQRTAPLVSDDPSKIPHPVLYAFDGATLAPLWRTAPGELPVGGKYGTATVARGVVMIGTDRLLAFGMKP
jgi:hypothetical protein